MSETIPHSEIIFPSKKTKGIKYLPMFRQDLRALTEKSTKGLLKVLRWHKEDHNLHLFENMLFSCQAVHQVS